MKTNLTKELDSLGVWLYRKDSIFRETVLFFLQFCLQSYLVSIIKRNCVEITSSYEIDEIHYSSDKFMRAAAIGRFKTWTGLDWIFGSLKGVICVSKDSIGFPKEIFGSSKEVSQMRIRVSRRMYVDQFEVFLCTNRSIVAAQQSQTSRFNVGFSGKNSEPTIKQRKVVFFRKHRAHCLKAMPGYRCKLAKHCKQILLPEIVKVFTRTCKESNVPGTFQWIR